MGKERYDRHRLLRLDRSPQALQLVQNEDLDVWSEMADTIDILASPTELHELQSRNISFNPIPLNLQSALDDEDHRLFSATSTANNALLRQSPRISPVNPLSDKYFDDFRPLDQITGWIHTIASAHPSWVTLVQSIGSSVQNRPISALHITSSSGRVPYQAKKRIWIQSLVHAREWIGVTSVQWCIRRLLLLAQSEDPIILDLLDKVEFIFVPLANPDGYHYSWTSDRLWRKNRKSLHNGSIGVDLNRNWPNHWGMGGTSKRPDSDTFRGSSAASEPEIQSLMTHYANTGNIIAALDVHSFSQVILFPPGWTHDASVDAKAFEACGRAIQSSIRQVRNIVYTPQRISQFYIASGSSVDWWYDTESLTRVGSPRPYALAMELSPSSAEARRNSTVGFIVNPSLIRAIGDDLYAGILALAHHALAHPLGLVEMDTTSIANRSMNISIPDAGR